MVRYQSVPASDKSSCGNRRIQRDYNMNATSLQCSRDNRTAIELFLDGLGGWNATLRRHFPEENSDN